MFEIFVRYRDLFLEFTTANPVIAGVVSLYGLGIITFLFRNIPLKLLNLIKYQFTTSMTLTSQHLIFHKFTKWLHNTGYSHKFRRFKLSNGKWGDNLDYEKRVGTGSHLFWYKFQPYWLSLEINQNTAFEERETLTLTKIGRSHTAFNSLTSEFSIDSDPGKLKIYSYSNDCWQMNPVQPYRKLESIYIGNVKQEILKIFDDFNSKKDWYLNKGIPYKLTVMLHGPPGTGKTSIIKALASYLKRDVYILKPSHLYKIAEAGRTMEQNSILVIEDIDSNKVLHERDEKRIEPNDKIIDDKIVKTSLNDLSFLGINNLSDVLNTLDGICEYPGRITILTTNKPEVLDKALIRKGRIDFSIEIGYVTPEIFCDFVKSFYEKDLDASKINIKPKTSVADLQGAVLEEYSLDSFIWKFTL